MFRLNKTGLLALFVLPVALTACKPTRGTASPEDYFPLIQVALAGGETAAMIGRNEALDQEGFAGCVTGEAVISVLDASQQVLGGKIEDKLVFPALSVDYSECMPLADKPPKDNQDVSVLFASLTDVTLQALKYYGTKLYMSDCEKGLLALGAFAYVEGMVGPISMEIAHHDGMLEIPAVELDLECGE